MNVAVGSSPTVGELAGAGTDLDDYESSIECSGDSSSDGFELRAAVCGHRWSAGDVVDCTITNSARPA